MEKFETFYVDGEGCVEGRPYVLPHKPGEQAFGLVEGWYFYADELEGPFTTWNDAISLIGQYIQGQVDPIYREASPLRRRALKCRTETAVERLMTYLGIDTGVWSVDKFNTASKIVFDVMFDVEADGR